MKSYVVTITAIIDAESPEDARAEWAGLLAQPSFVTDGTVVEEQDDTPDVAVMTVGEFLNQVGPSLGWKDQ